MRKFVAITLSLMILAAVFLLVNPGPALASIREISIHTLLLCLALILVNLLLVSFRLQRMLRHFGNNLPFSMAFHATLSGLVASLFLINIVGSVVGRQMVLRSAGVSPALSTFISGYERLILALVGGALAVWGGMALIGSSILDDLFKGLPIVPMIIALCVVSVGVAMTATSSFEKSLLSRLRHPARLLEATEIVVVAALSLVLNMYIYTVVLSSMGFSLPLWKVMAASAMVSFAASLPISVNGWGVREISSIYAFGLLGVDAPSATAASIVVGLLNTAIIVVVSPLFIYSRRFVRARADVVPVSNDAIPSQGDDARDFSKISSLTLGLSVPILLFFQFPINVAGTTVTLNLGDLFALLAVGMVLSQIVFSGSLNFRLSIQAFLWIALVSFAIYFSLAIGALRYGPIPWAIGNRGIGWLVVLGYFACGALLTGEFGRHGVRRLAQVLLLTAVVVILVHLLHRIAYSFEWTQLPPPQNFEGFSANRNAFALQLLVTFSLALCYLLKRTSSKSLIVAMMVVLFGSIATNSLTGFITIGCIALATASSPSKLISRFAIVAAGGILLYIALPTILQIFTEIFYQSEFAVLRLWAAMHGEVFVEPLIRSSRAAGILQDLPVDRLGGKADSSVTERLASLRGGLALWREHPIVGAGLGAFIKTQISETGTPLVIHSTFVWILAEMGIAGLLLTGWIPLMQLGGLWRQWMHRPKRVLGGLRKNDSAVVIVVMVFCIFSLAHEVAYQRIFWLVLGALLAKPGQTSISAWWASISEMQRGKRFWLPASVQRLSH